MRKSLFYLALIAALFAASCKKDHNQGVQKNQSAKKYAVNFSVNGNFTQSITGNAVIHGRNLAILPSEAAIFYYYVYDTAGNLVHKIIQTPATATNFGNIQDSLANGTYSIIFAAGPAGLRTSVYDNGDDAYLSYAVLTYDHTNSEGDEIDTAWKDAFFKKLSLTVSSGSVTQSVTLSRIVSKVEVDILDALPATAKTFEVTYTQDRGQFSFATAQATQPYVFTSTTKIPAADLNKTGFSVSNIIGNTAALMTVTIKCYDASSNVIAQRAISNVSCQANKATVLSGNLFSTNSSFQMSLDTTFNPTPIVVHY